MSSETCALKNDRSILNNLFNAKLNNEKAPIEIPTGTSISNAELDSKLKETYSNIEANPLKTESDKFNAAVDAGKMNALSLLGKRVRGGKKQRGGETEEERIANENKALVVATVLTFIICDQTFGAGVSQPLTEYLQKKSTSLTGEALTLVNEVFSGVINSYAKALPGIRGGCEGALDYSIDIARDIPLIGSFVSLDNKLPTCAQRVLSYNETVASIRKILGELTIVAGATATSVGILGKYKDTWNSFDKEDTPSAVKVAAICKQLGGDTMSLGSTTINALLYVPLASVKALSRIVPQAAGATWTAVQDPTSWFKSWTTLNDSTDKEPLVKKQKTDLNDTGSSTPGSDITAVTGGRRTRRRKHHKKAAKKSRKQKKKRSSPKHKKAARKTRRGGSCKKHKKTRRKKH